MPITTLNLLRDNLASHLNTGWDINILSDTINITQDSQGNTIGNFDFIVDLEAGKKIKEITYQYRLSDTAVDFYITFENDSTSARGADNYKLNFSMNTNDLIKYMTFELVGEGKKKKAVSTDPDLYPISGVEYSPVVLEIEKPFIETPAVYNDWDIFVLSNHKISNTSTGIKIDLSFLIDRPNEGVFQGVAAYQYYNNLKMVEFVLKRSHLGGGASGLSSHALSVQLSNLNKGDVHYFGFKYDDDSERKKVISADPDNRPLLS